MEEQHPKTQSSDQSGAKDRRDFLKIGAMSALALGCGSTCGCSGGGEKSEPYVHTTCSGDTVKLLTPDGELVEVDTVHIKHHPHHAHMVAQREAREGIPGRKFVMVIDLARCNNARKCVTACQKMHYLPEDREWLSIKLMEETSGGAPAWFPKTCFHCDNPPCVKVCPVDATFKRDDGLVLIDADRCIGCKFCMTACPYSARVFNWSEENFGWVNEVENAPNPEWSVPPNPGTVEKCDFCPEMAREGELPDCVTACPNGVFYFGDENEDIVSNGSETVRFSELIKERAGYRYMEELGTKPRVYYLPPVNRIFPVERGYESLPDDLKARYDDVMKDG